MNRHWQFGNARLRGQRSTRSQLLVACLLSGFAAAQVSAEEIIEAPPKGFEAFVKYQTHLPAEANKNVRASIVVYNGTSSEIEITALRTSCSCIAVDFQPLIIKPETQDEIKLVLNTAGRGDKYFGTVVLECEQGKKFSSRVDIRFDIQSDGVLVATPESVFLGDVFPSEVISRQIQIGQPGTVTRRTKLIDVEAPPWIRLTLDFDTENNSWTLHVRGKVPEKEGQLIGALVLHTDCREHPRLEVPILGNCVGEVIATPNNVVRVVDLKQSDRDNGVTILFRMRESRLFTVERAHVTGIDPALLSVSIPLHEPRQSHNIICSPNESIDYGEEIHVEKGAIVATLRSEDETFDADIPLLLIWRKN